jgi:hypothetical protein
MPRARALPTNQLMLAAGSLESPAATRGPGGRPRTPGSPFINVAWLQSVDPDKAGRRHTTARSLAPSLLGGAT